MKNSKYYLYGASIQGIQSFILQTDKLKDIVGASELVEKICTDFFYDFKEPGNENNGTIIEAAGNIKYLFSDYEKCKYAVLEFPKKVMEAAPGITVSQAVIAYDDAKNFEDAINKLELRLKSQRNKQYTSTHALMSMRRSRQTALPVTKVYKDDYIDESTAAKRETANDEMKHPVINLSKKCFGKEKLKAENIAFNIEDITDRNDWVAIIHADGNGLGLIVQKVGKHKEDFKKFSDSLGKATEEAAQNAYNKISNRFEDKERIPIRPVVLGGDDFTVICRADFAIEYTQHFLKEFEVATEKYLGDLLKEYKVFKNNETKLTACAGIAYIKSSYPFHYGYRLSDELCTHAKKNSRKDRDKDEVIPSSLMFHKVQDSFAESYEDIIARELTTIDEISFKYGPYYLSSNDNKPLIDELLDNVQKFEGKDGSAVKTHLRQWLSDMTYNKEMADQRLKRLKSNIKSNKILISFVDKITSGDKIATYDLLSLHSIFYNVTKNAE